MAGIQIRGGLAAIAALSTAAAVHADPTPLYVDAAAPAGGNGSSWSQAFRDLQDALSVARLDPDRYKQYDIRVAQGVYTPDRGTGNRAMTFLVASGMTLTGGFAGLAGANPDQRDPSQFVSVLSGDLSHNDVPPFGNTSENTYTVLTINPQSPSSPLRINGFTISGGNGVTANAPGGISTGLSSSVEASISSCVIKNNQGYRGGGVSAGAWLSIHDSTIESNGSSQQGGGIYSSGQTLFINRCVVTKNFSEANFGGGVSATYLIAQDTAITDNYSLFGGGGVYATSRCTLANCLVAGNSTGPSGSGGGVYAEWGQVSLLSSLIAHNTSATGGGVSLSQPSAAAINHCTLVGNATSGSGGAIELAGLATLSNSVLANNTGVGTAVVTSGMLTVHRNLLLGGAVGLLPVNAIVYDATNINADPMFENGVGTSTVPTAWRDKDYRLRRASLGVDAADSTNWPDYFNDVAGQRRGIDILVTPNTGTGSKDFLDLGAYETQRACRGDFDGSGQVTIDDLFWFFNVYFVGDLLADMDGWGTVTIDDLFIFINAWFTGC